MFRYVLNVQRVTSPSWRSWMNDANIYSIFSTPSRFIYLFSFYRGQQPCFKLWQQLKCRLLGDRKGATERQRSFNNKAIGKNCHDNNDRVTSVTTVVEKKHVRFFFQGSHESSWVVSFEDRIHQSWPYSPPRNAVLWLSFVRSHYRFCCDSV